MHDALHPDDESAAVNEVNEVDEVDDADAEVDVADVSGGAVPEQLLEDPREAVEESHDDGPE